MLVDEKGLWRRERLPGIRELMLGQNLPPLEEQVPSPRGTAQSGHSSLSWGSSSLSSVGPGSAFRANAFCQGEPRKRQDSGSSLTYSVDSQRSSQDSSTSGPNEELARRQSCSSNSSAALSGGVPRSLPARRQQLACSRTRPQSENHNNMHAKLKEAIDDANKKGTEKCKNEDCAARIDKAWRTSVFSEGDQLIVRCSACQVVYYIEKEKVQAFVHRHQEQNRRNGHNDWLGRVQSFLIPEATKGAIGSIGTPLTKQNQRDGKHGRTTYQKTDLLKAVPELFMVLYGRIKHRDEIIAQLAEENSRLAQKNAHLRQQLGVRAGHADGNFTRPDAAAGDGTFGEYNNARLHTPVSDQSSQPPSPKRVKEDSSSTPEPRSTLKDRTSSWRKRR